MIRTNVVCSLVWIALCVVPSLADTNEWVSAMTRAAVAKDAARFDDAERAYADAIRATEQDPGLARERAVALARRASILHDLQRVREAEKGYLEAIRTLRSQPAEGVRIELAPLVISLAALYLENDQPSKAIALNVEQLLPVLESRIQLANSYSILGSIAFVQSRLADAETWWQRSAAICEAEKLTQEAAVSLSNLGTLKAAQGDYKGATVYFRKSVEYFTTSIGLEHPLAVKAQSNLGQSLFRLRRYQEATQWLEKAHYLARKWYGSENAITIQLCLDHAEALRKLGRKDEAKAMVTGVQRMPAAVSAALPGRSTVDVLQLGDDGLRK